MQVNLYNPFINSEAVTLLYVYSIQKDTKVVMNQSFQCQIL